KTVFKNAPLNQTTDDCGTLTLETRDAEDNPSPVAAARNYTLSNNLAGTFYTNPGCTGPTTTVTVPMSQSEVTFYFRDLVVQNPTLTAVETPSQGWADATQGATITVGAITQIVITSTALNQVSGICGAVA